MVENWDIHNLTLTGNWTHVKSLRRGTKQLVSRRNNWAIHQNLHVIKIDDFFSLRTCIIMYKPSLLLLFQLINTVFYLFVLILMIRSIQVSSNQIILLYISIYVMQGLSKRFLFFINHDAIFMKILKKLFLDTDNKK